MVTEANHRTRAWIPRVLLLLVLSTATVIHQVGATATLDSIDEAGCTLSVTKSAQDFGIAMMTDLTCTNDKANKDEAEDRGGCISSQCRLCQVRSTPQSQKYRSCASVPKEISVNNQEVQAVTADTNDTDYSSACLVQVSSGDAAVGVNVITDSSCANGGGLGCFATNCRFCKTVDTPQSEHWQSCGELLSQSRDSDLVKPSTPAPAPPTAAPVVGNGSIDTCTYVVSPGDALAGIAVVTDASCRSGGIGCLKNVCRLCKFVSTNLSSHLLDCDNSLRVGSMSTPSTATTTTPATITVTPSTPSPPAAATSFVLPLAPQADNVNNQELFETPPINYCLAYLIGRDQAAAGVWTYVDDERCVATPSRCVLSVCRLCKFAELPLSTQYEICPSSSLSITRRN
ncbi:hypothetical protein FI667_g1239, partial [Globisporangium splendens]